LIPIVEKFYSIQGEGPRISPAVFVRNGLCNFKCEGFGCSLKAPDGTMVKGCDSIRAVSPKFKDNWTNYVDFEDLVNDIDNIMPEFSKHNVLKPDIIWTGGEPLLFWKDEVMQRTLSHYLTRGHRVTVETNGSLDVNFTREFQKQLTFSISVKLQNSGEPAHKRLNIDNVTNLIENSTDSYLKFVVSENTWDDDWDEIKTFLKSLPIFAKVFLMPLGETQKEVQSNTQFILQKCVDLGFWYSDRLHIRAWNDKVGV
jgi:7-carboxy-7-deazaguanine synthase